MKPLPPTGDAALEPAEQRIKQAGLTLLARLSAALRTGHSHDAGNQAVVKPLEGLLEALAPLLEESGEIVLVALDDDFYLNGVRIPARAGQLRAHKSVHQEFRRRRIAGIRAQAGLAAGELGSFFRLLMEPEKHTGPELLRACIAQGIDHILPALQALAAVPDDAFEYEADPARGEIGVAWAPSGARGPAAAGGDGAGTGAAQSAPREPALRSYSLAIQETRSLLTAAARRGGLELRHARRLVQPLVDAAFAAEPAVIGLATPAHPDEYAYAHAVNTCLVAVTMGHFLELDRAALSDLGVAALLHDLGKAAVANRVQHPLEAFTEADRAAAERHPLEGARVLAGATTLNATTLRCMRVALEHHTSQDGTGYPAAESWEPSLLSRLVAVADCYVSLQTHRSARGATVTPYQALGMMLGSLRPRFHPAMLWALVQTVGFYPPGQLVELDDGSIATVLAPHAEDLARPHLRLLLDVAGGRLAPSQQKELRPLPPDRNVRRALKATEYPSDPGQTGKRG